MSNNNELIILKNKKGEFEIHENLCVDDELEPDNESLLTKESCIEDAIRFANKYCSENTVEYGYHINDSCLSKKEDKLKRKFKVTKEMQEEINKSRKECGLKEEPIKEEYELEYLYG